jgi:hypothetical protein
MPFRKLGSATISRRGETRRVLENDEKKNGSVLSEFRHFGFLSSFDIRLQRPGWTRAGGS